MSRLAGRLTRPRRIGHGELIPKRVFNLTGLRPVRPQHEGIDDVGYRRTQSGNHQDNATKAGDTGSPEVQVAILRNASPT